jgi:hypothetical protein
LMASATKGARDASEVDAIKINPWISHCGVF